MERYAALMREFAPMPRLEVSRYQVHRIGMAKPVHEALVKAERATPQHTLEQLTTPAAAKSGATRRFKEAKPMLTRISGVRASAVLASLAPYRAMLEPQRQHLLSFYRVADVAFKVVGTGSVGLRDYCVYLEGNGPNDPLFLQIKEETASAYAPYLPDAHPPAHNGQRAAEGQRAIEMQSDPFLGWTHIGHRHFLVRQLNDHKGSIEIGDLAGGGLTAYAEVCGELLARGHARSGDPLVISGYIGVRRCVRPSPGEVRRPLRRSDGEGLGGTTPRAEEEPARVTNLMTQATHSTRAPAPNADSGEDREVTREPLRAPIAGHLARSLALEAGFAEAGLVALPYPEHTRDGDRFEEWVQAGRAGTMRYLERRAENGELYGRVWGRRFPGRARLWSVLRFMTGRNRSRPRPPLPTPAGSPGMRGPAARTNVERRRPSDYHKVLLKRLKALDARLRAELAVRVPRLRRHRPGGGAGPGHGRRLGLDGEKRLPDSPQAGVLRFSRRSSDFVAGRERRSGCPAGAGPGAGIGSGPMRNLPPLHRCLPDRAPSLRRTRWTPPRCISYLTIEHKGLIAEELMEGMGRQVFGCDICQDVCPWNRKALREAPPAPNLGTDPELETRAELVNPALEWLAAMDEAEFEKQFNGSPVRRAGIAGLRRNLAIAMGNSGLGKFAAQLEAWAADADDGLRGAARWALGKLHASRLLKSGLLASGQRSGLS